MAELWVAGAGAAGGALAALVTKNLNLLPIRVSAGARPILRPGLALSVLAGTVAAVAALYAFVGVDWEKGIHSGTTLVTASTAALCIGALSANCLSNRADMRLLRAAACEAAGSPAAHPETVAAMAIAAPNTVLEVASRLVPSHGRRLKF